MKPLEPYQRDRLLFNKLFFLLISGMFIFGGVWLIAHNYDYSTEIGTNLANLMIFKSFLGMVGISLGIFFSYLAGAIHD